MTYFLKMKMESLFFVVNCWSLLTMNYGLAQNRDSIFIIFEWANTFICAVRSTTLILCPTMLFIHCVRIARVASGLVLILAVWITILVFIRISRNITPKEPIMVCMGSEYVSFARIVRVFCGLVRKTVVWTASTPRPKLSPFLHPAVLLQMCMACV